MDPAIQVLLEIVGLGKNGPEIYPLARFCEGLPTMDQSNCDNQHSLHLIRLVDQLRSVKVWDTVLECYKALCLFTETEETRLKAQQYVDYVYYYVTGLKLKANGYTAEEMKILLHHTC